MISHHRLNIAIKIFQFCGNIHYTSHPHSPTIQTTPHCMSNLYKVEKIVGKKVNEKNQVLYKVKWRGYPEGQNTWEPVKHLRAVQDMIEAFEKKNEKKIAETLRNNQYQKTKNDHSKQKSREACEPRLLEVKPTATIGRPRKLVKDSQSAGQKRGKSNRSDQYKSSELQEYYVSKPTTSLGNEEEGAGSFNLSFLEARIRELAEQKEVERERIVEMFLGENGEFIYKVAKGKQTNIQSRDYVHKHCTDQLIDFYESKIQFPKRNE